MLSSYGWTRPVSADKKDCPDVSGSEAAYMLAVDKMAEIASLRGIFP
jgi:hypothetical protein